MKASQFRLASPYEPKGDQPQAIRELTRGLQEGRRHQTLLGVTGSGKTFTIANVIAAVNKPTLVVSHNKTLAAQLYSEFKQFFPENAVGYFVSYYDYYQPEAYIPSTDTYIEKDASINQDIDRLRLQATSSLFERRDVVIVASVSCIYNLGSPEDYRRLMLALEEGQTIDRDEILAKLVEIQYERNDIDLKRGAFRVRGDVVELRPSYDEKGIRIELFGDEVEKLSEIDLLTGRTLARRERIAVYPAKHFVTPPGRMREALKSIRRELKDRLECLSEQGKLLEAQRLKERTNYDLEMLGLLGYCSGVENYSRHLSGRREGEPPHSLLDYFPDDFLTVIDESHVTVPQLGGMYEGDHSRKSTLVEYGFRLPSALDNRPLRFDEFKERVGRVIYISATPAEYELEASEGVVVEQVIRPTGLVDPAVSVRPTEGQIDDLLKKIRARVEAKERVLVTTLTKRMAEELADFLTEMGVKVRYIHSDVAAIERVEILRGLRLAEFDVLVGINLLREGLDLPEVSLVAILDADKEGFLRSERSLIQTAGRSARHISGKVILYADNMTGSMRRAISETNRRRRKQLAYNEEHGIVPRSIVKSPEEVMRATSVADAGPREGKTPPPDVDGLTKEELIERMEKDMLEAARGLEFEKAASLRDRIEEVKGAL